MKLRNILLAAAVLSTPAMVPAIASAEGVTTSVNLGVSTDYIWRGQSQSGNQASAFGGIDASTDLFYVGAWAGQVKLDNAKVETDLYAGVKPKLGPIDFDLGVIAYMYPEENDYNTYEAKIGASHTYKNGISTGLTYYYADEVGKNGPSNNYVEANVKVPFSPKVGPFNMGMTAAVGYNDAKDADDYYNAKVAFTAVTDKGWGIEVGATTTDIDQELMSKHDAKFVSNKGYVSLSKAF